LVTVPSTVLITAYVDGDSNRIEKRKIMNAAIEWDLRSFIEPTNVNLLKTALSLISQVLENRKKVLS